MSTAKIDGFIAGIRNTIVIYKNVAIAGIFLLIEVNRNSENLPPELVNKIRKHIDSVLQLEEFSWLNDTINRRNRI